MAPCAFRDAGGAPAAAIAAAQAAEIAARLGARMAEPAEKLSKGALQGFEYARRFPGSLPAVPSEPLVGSLLTPQSTSAGQTTAAEATAPFDDPDLPAPLPRLGGNAADRTGASLGSWQARRGSPPPVTPLDAGTEPISLSTSTSPRRGAKVREAQAVPRVPPVNLEAISGSGMTSPHLSQVESTKPSSRGLMSGRGQARAELLTTLEGREMQASLPQPPTSVLAPQRGRSRPTSPYRSDYDSGPEALPPVPSTAMWFASKAEELERRRSRSTERLEALGYASVWPPPPLPPLSEELRARLERLEVGRTQQREDLSITRSLEESAMERCADLEVQLEQTRTQEGALQARLSSSEAHAEEAQRKLQHTEADRARLENRIASVQQQTDTLREELQNAKARLSTDRATQRELRDLEAERDRLRSRYGESEKLRVDAAQERDALRDELRQLEDGLALEKQQSAKAEGRVKELQRRLQDRETSESDGRFRGLEELEELASAKASSERRLGELQQKLAEQSAQLRKSAQEAQRWPEERQSLERRVFEQQGRLSQMDSLQSELAELREKNHQLEEDAMTWQEVAQQRAKAADSLRQAEAALKQERSEQDLKLKALHLENESLKAKFPRRKEREHRQRRVTVQPVDQRRNATDGSVSSSSRRHTVVEIDLLSETPRMEEREEEDESSSEA